VIGGIVIETVVLPDRVWINCAEKDSTSKCAIYVENDAKARCVSPGDNVWWQRRRAMWTPGSYKQGTGKQGHQWDIVLQRIGYSGVSRPAPLAASNAADKPTP